ncbi:glycosyltransferase, partial [Candidatus Micrarchaeota archaeon]|nr:glycosyltransferase [Candidatus Micrarchaeota archaeon]
MMDVNMEEYLQYDEIKTVHSKVEIPSLWIVIPFYNELVALKAHLEVLEKQTKKDFFVVVVASNICESKEVLDTVKRFSLQIAILKRKNDTGSAGAFALGTTYALNHNCDAVIFADVDALPFENDLVENIYSEFLSGNELILPKVRQIVDDKSVGVDYSINIYGLLSARIIRIIGVHYVPAYLGGEDMELVQRAESLVKKKLINKSVSHPIMQFGSRNLERSTVYVTNLALLTIPKNFPYYFFL